MTPNCPPACSPATSSSSGVSQAGGLTMRPYQGRIIEEVQANFRAGVRAQVVTAPTGSGKTALAANMLHRAAERGRRSWFVVHRRELIMQAASAFAREGLPFGIVSAGFPSSPGKMVQICSIQSLVRRLDKVAKPTMVVWDEAHHSAASSWSTVYDANPQAWHVGLTATPQRLDGKGLDAYFQRIVMGPTVAELIAQGWLAGYKLYAPPGVDATGFTVRMGDYVRSQVEAAADRPHITGCALEHYRRLAPGRTALIFASSIRHSQHVADQFTAAGIRAAHLDGDTPTAERDQILRQFRAGEVTVLTNVALFGEGFDVPGIHCVLDLAPTCSLTNWLQRCGRALRPCDGKDHAIILDAAGNAMRHGLPDDDREWSLAGREEKPQSRVATRTCPECFYVVRPWEKVCPDCGHVFAPKPREIATVAGDLEEVDPAALRAARKREERDCDTVEALTELGRKRNYQYPEQWARKFHAAREAARAKYRRVMV